MAQPCYNPRNEGGAYAEIESQGSGKGERL